MAELNPQQKKAVAHKDGPLMVLAGAGTGKTRVVTERIAALIQSGVPPRHILGVTFTNKASAEMRARLGGRMRKTTEAEAPTLCTFHSLALRILRRDPEPAGYRPGFSLCGAAESRSLARKASLTVQGAARHDLYDIQARVSFWKNSGVRPEMARREAASDFDLVASGVYRRYQEALARMNCADFDDLLERAFHLLRQHPDSAAFWRDRYRYLLVDEFQDANPIQYELARFLASPGDNLCVVGDDDQSIYAWRGAVPRLILDFPETYAKAAVITLEENYRSTSAILRSANAVISAAAERRRKVLRSSLGEGEPVRLLESRDQHEEASRVAKEIGIRLARGAKPGDCAIILRTGRQGRPFEDELHAARLPYSLIGGQRFYDRDEIRDILAYMAVIANPAADVALFRVANTPPRGLGDKSLDALAAFSRSRKENISSALATPAEAGLAGKAAEGARELAMRLASWRRTITESENGLSGLVETICEDIRYADYLAAACKDPLQAARRHQSVLSIGDTLRTYMERMERDARSRSPSLPAGQSAGLAILAGFTQEISLREDGEGENKTDANDDAIKLITGHSAKGLEFDHVFVPGLEEGLWPHRLSGDPDTDAEDASAGEAPNQPLPGAAESDIEEERRLLFVAMTRARRSLTLSRCLARAGKGKSRPSAPSRFLADLPANGIRVEAAYLEDEDLTEWLRERARKPSDARKSD